MGMINHREAISLEHIVRRVYNCERFGVMGVANSDHLERHPMDAAIVIFAPLYQEQKVIEDIDSFIDEYSCIFNFHEDYEYNEQTVNNYIEGLRRLVDKYF